MHQQISKRIIIYLFIFLFLGTLNNKNFLLLSFEKDNYFEIKDLSETKNDEIIQELSKLNTENLFILKKDEVSETIKSHKIVERFFAFKNYPSNLNIKIEKTKFLAITKKNSLDYYVGTNGNLIKVENIKEDLPFIFGDVDVLEFLKLKNIIDNSSFDYSQIKKFYYFKSKRWDIETKDGLLINLPSKNLNNSFKILLRIQKNNDFNDYRNIDLRQQNQIIVNG
jgi:cell division protein FtsQ